MFYKNFKPIGFVETLVLNSSQGLLKNFRLSKFKKNNAKTNVISEIHSLNGLLLLIIYMILFLKNIGQVMK